jgi:hypothetical protein
MIVSRRSYPLQSCALTIRGWSWRRSPEGPFGACLLENYGRMRKRRGLLMAKPSVWRDESARPMDWSKVRPEDIIKADLAKQLEALLKKQQERWKCP